MCKPATDPFGVSLRYSRHRLRRGLVRRDDMQKGIRAPLLKAGTDLTVNRKGNLSFGQCNHHGFNGTQSYGTRRVPTTFTVDAELRHTACAYYLYSVIIRVSMGFR